MYVVNKQTERIILSNYSPRTVASDNWEIMKNNDWTYHKRVIEEKNVYGF